MLKAQLLALQRSLAGSPMTTLRELEPDLPLPRLSKGGLPTIIGTQDRRLIRGGHTATIRWWLTLFSLYRVLDMPGKLKVSTITDPFSGDNSFLQSFNAFVPVGIKSFAKFVRGVTLEKSGLLAITKSGPCGTQMLNVSKSYLGLLRSGLLSELNNFIQLT